MSNIVDIDVIEGSKENIQPRASGRSARALVASLTPTSGPVTPQGVRGIQSVARSAFEKELETASELDDPLEVWVRYFQWTLDTFPAGNTKESGMVNLLERATTAFLREAQYKNDPRYLKMWIHYIQHYSEAPREHFAYLARHDIGQRLALFYEEFAALLESIGRKNQAAEVYQRGIENNARPVERLIRKYAEFRERLEANPADPNEPSSPAIPASRPALAARPFGGVAATPDPQSRGLSSATPASGKPKKNKLQVFSDADAEPTPQKSTKGWESIGSLADRKKENTMEARPWAGETLKQDPEVVKKKAPKEKLMVFRDASSKSKPKQKFHGFPTQHHPDPSRPNERVAVDLESMYPSDNKFEEYSIEELLAKSRGIYGLDWDQVREEEAEAARQARRRERQIREQRQLEQQRQQRHSHSPGFKDTLTPVKVPMVMSPEPNKGKIKKRNRKEATMTIHTKEATDDIYDMFNQPLEQSLDDEDDSSEEESDSEGDYLTVDLTKKLGPQNATSEDEEDEDEDSDEEEEEEEISGEEEEEAEEEEEDEEEEDFSEFSESDLQELADNTESNRGTRRVSDGPTKTPRTSSRGVEISTPDDYNPPLHRYRTSDADLLRKQPYMTPITEADTPPPTTERRRRSIRTPGRYDEEEEEEYEVPAATNNRRRSSGRLSSGGQAPEKLTRKRVEIPPPPEDFDPPLHPYRNPQEAEQRKLPFMTPITEVTERLPPTTQGRRTVINTPTKYAGHSSDEYSSDEYGTADESFVTPTGTPMPQIQDIIKGRKANALQPKVPATSTPLGGPRGPIIDDAQCNPCDSNVRSQILNNVRPALASYDGFNLYTNKFGKSDLIRRHCRAPKKDGSSSGSSVTITFPAAKAPYIFKKELGKGAFAPVYLVENTIFGGDDSDNTENELGLTAGLQALGRRRFEAVKMEHPPSAWEYYIIRTAKQRLGYSRAASSIVTAHEFHRFPDECYLVLDYFSQGTIIDLVNLAKNDSTISTSGQIDEQLVMFLTIELLRTVEALHANNIIHGDLKADNCLVRFEPIPDSMWSSKYRADGDDGWAKKGLVLIDFGRGIDMTSYKPDVQFIADWPPDAQDCAEIREMRPWTYQIDYHGIAGIIHTMLFGKFIETVAEKVSPGGGYSSPQGVPLGSARKRYRVASAFKRYWQQDIWADCFDVLLNSGSYAKGVGALPVEREIREVRRRMEGWLEGNSERGAGLKTVIRRMEAVLSKRK